MLVYSKHRKITVQRELLNEADFEEGFHPIKSTIKKNWYKSFIPPEPICSSLLPPTSKRDCKLFLFTHLPILGWLWSYQPKFLVGDIIAGITVAIMRIPQGQTDILNSDITHSCIIIKSGSLTWLHVSIFHYRIGLCSIGRIASSIWSICIICACYCLLHFWHIKAYFCW